MDSPGPRADAHRAWLGAIALWTAFLGAALGMLVELWVQPAAAAGWEALSLLFLGHWLAATIAIGLALFLARPLFQQAANGR